MKIEKYIKPTLSLSLVALMTFALTVRADDSQASKENNNQSSENSDSSKQNDNKSNNDGEGGNKSSKSSSDNQSAGKISPVQATADPYGLKIAGPVMEAGSTATSANFDKNVLPSALQLCAKYLPDGHNNLNSPAFVQNIDVNKLVLATKQTVTATFIAEGAGFHNSVGFESVAAGGKDPQNWWQEVTASSSKLMFPDVSSPADFNPGGNYSGATRSASQLLLPGDFVNMGTFNKGTKLDFFMIANGANGGSAVFSSVESLNGDNFNHHVAAFTPQVFAAPQLNSPYVFIAFKDMWGGGDKDINDAVIALNVGAATVKSLLATPEPAMWLTLGSFLVLAVWAKRRMDCKALAVA